ncbi:TonB-dependent receptor [Novosphingobium terrae]|uniref:TonB-dependent receptor n=1 Tax=Novosphingobium terrae TaxID=2726189 RepID=UPI001980B1FC|nr:TonB-dependent receptor [Novosphingobium terrae]
MPLASAALIAASSLAAHAPATAPDPRLNAPIAAGSAAQVLGEVARQAGLAVAWKQGDLDGLRLPALPAGQHLSQALARLCPPAGLNCRITTGGLLVSRAPRPAPHPARPQRAKPPPMPAAIEDAPMLVVSGRRGLSPMLDTERSFSLTTIDAGEISRRAPQSMAALLDGIPGVWTDTSAGTSANTVRVRGMPLDGYSALAVEEDGLPIQHMTLPWTDIDQFMRPDIMLESADYVHGGPSSILASNAPGGLLDLHIRKPTAHLAGGASLTVTDYGLLRADGWISGPVGSWKVIAGGYLSRDPTVRRMAQTLGGGQVRLRAQHDLPDGSIRLSLRYQNDTSLNTSSYPLVSKGGTLSALPGFDPLRDSWFGTDLNHVTFTTAQGSVTRDIGRNNRNRLIAGNAVLVLNLGPATRLTARLGLRHSATERNAILSSGPPVTASAYLAQNRSTLLAAFPGATQLALRTTDTGASYTDTTGNGLVEVVQPTSATVGLDEALGTLELTHTLEAAGRHNLTLGTYGADSLWRYTRIVARALVSAQAEGQLLDLVAVDGSGQQIGSQTDGGFLSRSSTWEQTHGHLQMLAAYLTDEWQLARDWRVDAGLRHEEESLRGTVSLPVTLNLATATSLAGSATQEDSGQSVPYRGSFAATNATLAVNWHPAQGPLSLFARATRSHSLPGLGNYRNSPNPATAHAVAVSEGELGLVLDRKALHLSITGFANYFSGLDVSASTIDARTGAILTIPRLADATAVGLEGESRMRLARWLSARLSVTWQRSRLSDYLYTDASSGVSVTINNNGHVPQRVPDVMAMASLSADLPVRGLSMGMDVTGMGRRFADDGNTLRLPPYVLVGLNAQWAINAATSLRAQVSNLLNTVAVMQGDTIAGVGPGSAAGLYVTGRSLPGRVVQLQLSRQF